MFNVQLFLKKEPRFFCGFFCCAISVDLFLVQTPDAVPRSNPMRHSHFTNHVAMAVRESYITFFKTLLASDHPLPKQTSQKPSWGKENKIKEVWRGKYSRDENSWFHWWRKIILLLSHWFYFFPLINIAWMKSCWSLKRNFFLRISSVFKDIVLAVSEFYPHAQWRANTAGHSTTRETQKRIPSIFIIQYNIIHRINVNCVCTCE